MGMKDDLTTLGSGVGHQPVAPVQTLLVGHPSRQAEQVGDPPGCSANSPTFCTWRRGMTSRWLGACGSMSRKATECSDSATIVAGIVPATIEQNRQVGALMSRE